VLALLSELVEQLWSSLSWYLSLMWLCLTELVRWLWSLLWEGVL